MEHWQYEYRALKQKVFDIAHCVRVFSCVSLVVVVIVGLCYFVGRPIEINPNKLYQEEIQYMGLKDFDGDTIYINERGIILKDANGDTLYIGGR